MEGKESTPSYIDQFQILQSIDRGAYGQVFKAKDKKGDVVAIKKIYQRNQNLTEVKTQFSIAKKLNHPNLMKVIDMRESAIFNDANDKKVICTAIVLQYIGGGTILDFVNIGGYFSENVARTYFTQLVDALQYLHNQGYVHRDIKPDNVILSDQYVLKLVDFGWAKSLQSTDNKLKTFAGTEQYMAPQIYLGEYNGIKTDIFAIGVFLFTIRSAFLPFATTNCLKPTHYKLIKRSKWDKYWQAFELKKYENYYSADFKDLFQKLVCADPDKRLSIQQIRQHPWMKGKSAGQEEIILEFEKRKKMIEEEKQKKKESQLIKRNLRLSGQGESRGDGNLDRKFSEIYTKIMKQDIQLQVIEELSKQAFEVSENNYKYSFAALISDLEKFQLSSGQTQQSPAFKVADLQIKGYQITAAFECVEDIEEEQEQDQQFEIITLVKLTIKLGLNTNKKIIIDIKKVEGENFFFKKIAEEIKKCFSYCIV